ncbi:MAG TPA: FIST C-terminal domain-containing protein [Burkholderiales bacterium]|nr:FIST C-terminal domain-containing protein [Burkholderiales bacterium]
MFAYGHAAAATWRECVSACAERLGRPGRGLGFVYFTDAFVDSAAKMLEELQARTGVQDWVGSVGVGVLATGAEYQEEPAMAAMVADIDEFSVFSGRLPLKKESAHFAVVHADPAAPDVAGLIADLSAKVASGFLVGGLSSSRSRTVQIANAVLSGGLSGAALAPEVAVATRLTQGCVPYAGRFRVTECADNIIARLDDRPALDVLKEVIGNDRSVLVGLPVPGSDTGDYTARNLVGVDPRNKLIAIGELVEPGMELLFCKRDRAAARQDLERVVGELKTAVSRPRGALYFSCLARGEHMFGSRGAEQQLIRRALGEVPLVGFFCNGEISRDRLYGYTGVLTLFH